MMIFSYMTRQETLVRKIPELLILAQNTALFLMLNAPIGINLSAFN